MASKNLDFLCDEVNALLKWVEENKDRIEQSIDTLNSEMKEVMEDILFLKTFDVGVMKDDIESLKTRVDALEGNTGNTGD